MVYTHSSSPVERSHANHNLSDHLGCSYYLHSRGSQGDRSDMPITPQNNDIPELCPENGARGLGVDRPFQGLNRGVGDTTQKPGDMQPNMSHHHGSERISMHDRSPNGYSINENRNNTMHSHGDYIPETAHSGEHNLLVLQPSNNSEAAPGAHLQLPGPRLPRYSQKRHFIAIFDVILVIVAASFVIFAFLVQSSDGKAGGPGSLGQALLLAASYVSFSHCLQFKRRVIN